MKSDTNGKNNIKITIEKQLNMAEVVKECRLSRGLSQSDFGELVGISHAAISDIERGRTIKISQRLFPIVVDFIVRFGFIDNLPQAITKVKGGYPLRSEVQEAWKTFVGESL